MTWQPIATAPKDGTQVLVYPQICAGQYDQRNAAWWKSGAWITPTHWMPLPPPPDVEHQQRIANERAVAS